jgi:hypothetical protein
MNLRAWTLPNREGSMDLSDFQNTDKGPAPTMTIRWLSFLILFSALVGAEAQTINAASCNASDVQAAFSQVTASTTTVNIPAGTCAWTTQVMLTVPSGSGNLSILGAGGLNTQGGGDATVIVDNYASNNPIMTMTPASSATLLRIAGVTFQGGSGNAKWNGIVQINGLSQTVRVDHSHFNSTTYSPAVSSSLLQFNGCIYGVVDHSIFDNPAGSVNNSVRAYNAGSCNGDPLGDGDQSWATPTGLGSANFLFVENNTFNSGAGNDCTQGGRYVWRYNTMNMTSPAPTVQTHPTGGGQRERGCRAWEIYNNQFNAVSGNYISSAFWLSSGTGVIWNNTVPSSSAGGGTGYGNFVSIHSMRRDNSTYTQTATPNGWGYCGTSFDGVGSNWDQNSNVSTGYRCMDQPGQGVGQLLVNDFPNTVNSTTGTIAWSNEALEPVYEWMDSYSPVPNNPSNLLSVAQADAEFNNADFYYQCGSYNSSCRSFTGAFGTGSGPLSGRPSTCTAGPGGDTPGVAYWATDQNTLYVCNPTNTWTTYYTPYTYPHPLTQGPADPPSPPSSLQATVN